MHTYTQEQIIQFAQQCWPSDRRMWAVDANLPGLLRFVELASPNTNSGELREALKDMCAEFRALDLPYGSKAYSRATAALNSAPSTSITDKQVAVAIDTWFSKEFEYNSSMETRMRAAIEAVLKG